MDLHVFLIGYGSGASLFQGVPADSVVCDRASFCLQALLPSRQGASMRVYTDTQGKDSSNPNPASILHMHM